MSYKIVGLNIVSILDVVILWLKAYSISRHSTQLNPYKTNGDYSGGSLSAIYQPRAV